MSNEGEISRGFIGGILAVLGVVLCALFVWLFCFVTVSKGEVGIVSWFSEIDDTQTLKPGPHFVHPMKKVTHFNVQTRKNEEAINLPAKSGLSVSAKVVLIYHIDNSKAPSILRDVKGDFEENVVDPIFKNIARDVSAEYEAEALYTSARNQVEGVIKERVIAQLSPRGVVVEEVVIQDPVLPQAIMDRIQAKVAAEQDVIRMQSQFKITEQEGLIKKRTAELAAETREIEARGISNAQAIIKKELDMNYLYYLFIQAIKEHQGATIYIPTGTDGLPLFKHADKK